MCSLLDKNKEQLESLYKNYFEKYLMYRKLYQDSKDTSNGTKLFIEYVKNLEAVCALDECFYLLGISTTKLEKEVKEGMENNA